MALCRPNGQVVRLVVHRSGCRTVLVLTGYGAEQRAAIEASTPPDFVARDLLEAVQWILAQREARAS